MGWALEFPSYHPIRKFLSKPRIPEQGLLLRTCLKRRHALEEQFLPPLCCSTICENLAEF